VLSLRKVKIGVIMISAVTLNNNLYIMPIIKSAQKALRQSKKKKAQNTKTKKAYKGAVKKISKFISEGNKEKAQETLSFAMKRIDKAAKKNIFKKNTAARKKSQLAKAVNKIG